MKEILNELLIDTRYMKQTQKWKVMAVNSRKSYLTLNGTPKTN
jgi:hypothetical protein